MNPALPMLSVHGYFKKIRIDKNRSAERFLGSIIFVVGKSPINIMEPIFV